MKRWPWVAAALMALGVAFPVVADPPNGRSDYGIFCVQGRLVVEQKHIEELKRAFGGSVCRLDQDPSLSGARDKVERLGGLGAECSCNL